VPPPTRDVIEVLSEMPRIYTKIKQSLLRSGKSPRDAKRIAAATYIKMGKTKRASSN
jgi:hypothetical protein